APLQRPRGVLPRGLPAALRLRAAREGGGDRDLTAAGDGPDAQAVAALSPRGARGRLPRPGQGSRGDPRGARGASRSLRGRGAGAYAGARGARGMPFSGPAGVGDTTPTTWAPPGLGARAEGGGALVRRGR